MPPVPDLVRLSKLDAHFSADPQYTQHIYDVSVAGQRRVRREERWKRRRELGTGSFGAVYLERCIQGEKKGEVRAVKKIKKPEDTNYYRELDALSYFSHPKFERCFVKSFGWYDDADSIFFTMEYHPHGDLQRYLGAPLPEHEGQRIVYQILESLDFMHDSGFVHRDLKPANVLVVCKGPDWWVKIADFGISKRVAEGFTALRTVGGTLGFMAPELFGYIQANDSSGSAYTNAVDIWSAGVITFLILTGETYFRDQRRLGDYALGRTDFPQDVLVANSVSGAGCDFTKSLMAPEPKDRPRTTESLQHGWLAGLHLNAVSKTQRTGELIDEQQRPQFSVGSEFLTVRTRGDEQSTIGPSPQPTLEASLSWSTQELDPAVAPLVAYPLTLKASRSSSTQEVEPAVAPLVAPHSTIEASRSSSTQKLDPAGAPLAESAGSLMGTIQDSRYHSDDVTTIRKDSPLGVVENMPGMNARMTTYWRKSKRLKGHEGTVWALAFSPDGRLLASASVDRTVRLSKVEGGTGAEVKRLEGHRDIVWDVAFSPDGRLIASASGDRTIGLWEVAAEAAAAAEFKRLEGHESWVASVAFSPDGRLVVSASNDRTVRLWEVKAGVEVKRLEGHTGTVWGIAFSPVGGLVASASEDLTVRLWEVETGMEVKRLEGHGRRVQGVVFSPDGQLVASASNDPTVRLWDVGTGAEIAQLKGHTSWVGGVAFSPDGQLVASASNDQTVRLWKAAAEAGVWVEVKRFKGHEYEVGAVTFSPDGRLVASASADWTVRLWHTRRWAEAVGTADDSHGGFRKRLRNVLK